MPSPLQLSAIASLPDEKSGSVSSLLATAASAFRRLALVITALATFAGPVQAAFDINLTVDGSPVVDVGQFRGITVSYAWASLTQDLANAKIEVQLPATLDTNSTSDVQLFGSAHTTAAVYDTATRKITFTFINPLPAGSSGTVSFNTRFPTSAADGTLANIVGTSSGTGQPNASDNVTLEANTNLVTDLVMSKWANRYPMLDQDVTYTIRVQNNGTTSYLSPVYVDHLPAGTTFVSATDGGVYNGGANTVTWNLPAIDAGDSDSVNVTVRYTAPTFSTGQWVNNTANATGTDSLSAPVNLTAATDVQIAAPNPLAAVDKWDSNDPASLKGIFQYYFWVANEGNVPLTNYTVEDDFPVEFIPTLLYPGSDDTGTFTSSIAISYKTNFNASYRTAPGSPFTTNPGDDPYVDLSTIGLTPGEVVTGVRYVYASVPVGFDANWRPRAYGSIGHPTTGLDRNGAAITVPKTISNTINVTWTHSGTNYTGSDTETTDLVGSSPIPAFTIYDPVPESYIPLQEIKWTLRMENTWTAAEPLINPVYATLLPDNLEFVAGSTAVVEGPFALGQITTTVTDNYNGTGRQLVKFAFAGDHPVAWTNISGTSDDWAQYIDFRTKVKAGSAAGSFEVEYHLIGSGNTIINPDQFTTTRTDTNDLDGDGNTTEKHGTSNGGDYTINTSTAIDSVLWVKGQLDAGFNHYPDAGAALPGGTVQYKLIVTNPGNVPLTGIRVMDILPHVGDVGVILHSQSRGSSFAPALTSTVTAPAGITVKYSTSTNPVRTDLDASLTSPSGAVSGSFSTTAPAPLSNARSLLFDFGALVLNPAESKEITWTMSVPAGVTIGQVAWNSFGHRSQSAANGQALPPSEPVKVGIAIPISVGSFVWSDTNDNGIQNVGEPGISGVTVEIFKSDGSPALDPLGSPVASTTTDSNGLYAFASLADGDYFVRVTPPTPLLPGSVQVADPDNDIDTDSNIDTARTPPAGSWESGIFTFTRGSEPVGETGAGGTQDDVDDNDGNMTIDFGFKNCSTITLAAIGTNTVGTAYSSSAAATGGVGPYNYTVIAGALPAWASLNPSSGAITGTSNSTTTASFTIKATDANGCAGTRAYTLTPSCPLLIMSPAPGALAQGTVGAAYSQAFSSSGSTGTMGWSVFSGTLPGGLSINSGTGAITGNPSAPTTGVNGASFSVRAQDQYGCGITQAYTLKVCPTLTFPASMPAPIVGVNYNTLPGSAATAGGGTGPYNYSLSSAPAWMSVNASTGQISGTPLTVGTVSFTVNAIDAYGCTGSKSYTVAMLSVSVGNLVWLDTNNNGTKDASESGLAGATVQLFSPGADNAIGGIGANADGQVGTNIVTTASGAYIFSGLTPGKYFIKVTPPAGYIPGGTPATTDNDVDNNNDGSQPGGLGAPIYSPIVALTVNGESITDGDTDPTTNFTIDFGLWPGIQLGNEVWNDANDNATRDIGESGISGLSVELLNAANNAVIATTTTNGSGQYGFTVYTAGNYKVRVTPNSSLPIASTNFTNLDNSVDGDNNGSQPGTRDTPATSPAITLTAGAETGGTGNTETTIDFGFRACPTVTILPATVANGVWGIPYTAVQFSSTGHIGVASFTASGLPAGLSVSPTGILSGTPMQVGTFNFTVTETDAKACVVSRALSITILCPTLTMTSVPAPFPTAVMLRPFSASFAVAGGQGPRTYTVSGGSLPPGLTLSAAGVLSGIPSATGTYTFTIQSVDALPCTVQQQFSLTVLPPLSIGNLVFLDINGNGRYEAGEGLDGVTLQLYDSTQIAGVSTPLATTTTSGGGKYIFEGLLPGFYRVHVPASMFLAGAPLASTISIAEGLSGDDDVGENGLNSATPSITGITSGLITIQSGQAPTDLNGESGYDHASDNTYDAAIDLTVDFGFANPLGVGNLVFIDADLNGHYDPGEGVEGVTVDLYRSTDVIGVAVPLETTITDADGHYLFDYLHAGTYYIHIPSSQFNPGGALSGKVSMTGVGTGTADDGADENGIDDIAPIINGIRSMAFTLANNAAPTNATGETGYLASEDSRDDNNYDLTIDLGFRAPDPNAVGVGNAVFLDSNGNHFFDTGEGIDGVTVRLYTAGANVATASPVATTVTANGGSYFFSSLSQGSYFVYLPGSNFVPGAPLYRMLSLPDQGGDNGIDDDQDENGDDPASPAGSGVRSSSITLTANEEPTNTGGEFGSSAFMDDTDDNNNDLTVDFGFYRPVGVGNLVFIDANRNGRFNAGEGINGITVELYNDSQSPGFDAPLATMTTSGGGLYQFNNLVPGYYIVHIPTSNFAPGGGLASMSPLAGQGVDDGSDDDLDENGSDPELAFAEGVSSTTITLTSGSEPTDQTTEKGQGASSDNTADTDTDLTVDFGFQAASASSFAQWQASNPLGGLNSATDDPDGDGLNNAAEYALGLMPDTGVLPWCPFEIKLNTGNNLVDAFVRKLPASADATVTLQGLSDLSLSPGGWFDITGITPESVSTTNGVETSAWRNLEQIGGFAAGRGFVRLRVVLDTNQDGTPEASYVSDVWGWSRRSLAAQIITYSNPFSKCGVFTGAVTSVSGAALNVAAAAGSSSVVGAMTGSIPWYIEVVAGDNEGHRFEVNELSSTDTTIVLETSNTLNTLISIPASLAGDRIILRPRCTLAEWLPPSKFRATNSSGTADKLMFYSGAAFTTTWLYSNLGNPKWVSDATLVDRGSRVMDPCEALLIQPRSTSAPAFVNLGIVRPHKFASPLKQGTRLLAGGWPLDQSATSRNILYTNGFTGATSATRADRVQLWLGDTTPGASGYESHYLLKTTTLQQWVKSGDSSLTNENNLPLFKAFRGVYFNSYLGKPDYVAPRPWTP